MGFGHSWMSIYIPFLAIVAFFFSTWEEYHTGILYLGYINGPTEGLVLACLCMVLSGVYGMSSEVFLVSDSCWDYSLQTINTMKGPYIWKLPFHSVAPTLLSVYVPIGWRIQDVMAAAMLVMLVAFQIPSRYPPDLVAELIE